jgi:hypothetical protein
MYRNLIICDTMQSPTLPPPKTQAEADERRARAICEDGNTSDAAYGGGADFVIDNCMKLRLREIRAGMR